MHVITHFLTGWAATLPFDLDPRDRGLVACAAVSPDLDGLAVVVDLAQGRGLDACELYATCHHVVCHNLLFALVASTVLGLLADRRSAVGSLSLATIHLHFLADLVGSAGPDGSIWGIHYLVPFSGSWAAQVPWQWALNGWPNIGLTVGLIALALATAWSRGLSPVGVFSTRGDGVLAAALRRRFGSPPAGRHRSTARIAHSG